MTTRYAFCLVFLLSGCNEEAKKLNPDLEAYRGELRVQLYRECLAAAAKIERKGDDDVSDLIDSCSSTSYYVSNSPTAVPSAQSKP